MSFKVNYIAENGYITRNIQGSLNPNNLISSWEYLIEEKLKKQNFLGIITIYSDVELEMELDDFDHLLDLFKKNSSLLEKVKIAIVMETHIDEVFPLLTLRYSQFNIKSFSSCEAAKEWMLET